MKRLTKAEEEVMQIIWQLEPCLVSDIIKEMDKGKSSNETKKTPHSTISSIVRILEKKGFVDHKAYGRTHEYFPIVSKESYSKQRLKKLVTDYFQGSMNELVSFMVKEKDLKIEELNELLQRLEDSDNKKKSNE